ncbi:hypothetical protein CR513_06349, partial [Mucuna pruriens]
MDETTKVISKLEPNIYKQIKTINQKEIFGTIQAPRAWSQMNLCKKKILYHCGLRKERVIVGGA